MLSNIQKDTITEIVNVGVGKGSATLSQMLNDEVVLSIPSTELVDFAKVLVKLPNITDENVHAVVMRFDGEYSGLASLILPVHSATQLSAHLIHMPADAEEVIELVDGIMIELGNILINAIMGSFGNLLPRPFDYQIPTGFEGSLHDLFHHIDQSRYDKVLLCQTHFSIQDKDIQGDILIMYETDSFEKMKGLFDTLGI